MGVIVWLVLEPPGTMVIYMYSQGEHPRWPYLVYSDKYLKYKQTDLQPIFRKKRREIWNIIIASLDFVILFVMLFCYFSAVETCGVTTFSLILSLVKHHFTYSGPANHDHYYRCITWSWFCCALCTLSRPGRFRQTSMRPNTLGSPCTPPASCGWPSSQFSLGPITITRWALSWGHSLPPQELYKPKKILLWSCGKL